MKFVLLEERTISAAAWLAARTFCRTSTTSVMSPPRVASTPAHDNPRLIRVIAGAGAAAGAPAVATAGQPARRTAAR